MKKIVMLIFTLLIVITLSACNRSLCEGDNCVYVTVYPMQYLVEEIAGNYVEVVRVPGSNVHSESIDWSGKEIIDMKNADILFYINGGVDTYIPNEKEDIFADSIVKLVDVSETVAYNEVCFTHEHEHTDEDPHETFDCNENSLSEDPHFWLDPIRMLQAAELVKNELILAFPENELYFIEKYDILVEKLELLNTDFEEMQNDVNKPIITTVMLFSYFHVRYDIEILSITTSTHSSESSATDIIYFADEAYIHAINYIIFEKNTNNPSGDGVLEALIKLDSTASALYLHGLGNLTTEEMDDNLDYLSIMYDNLATLITATQ